MVKKKSMIPTFRTDQEERAFWNTHSFEEFADEMEEVDVLIQPIRTEQIALRLTKQDLDTLHACAKQRGVGHTTLARSIVEQWLMRSRHKGASNRPSRSSRVA